MSTNKQSEISRKTRAVRRHEYLCLDQPSSISRYFWPAEYTLSQNLKLTFKKKPEGPCFRGAPILSCILPPSLCATSPGIFPSNIFVVQSLFTGERQFTELYYKDFPIHEIKYLFGSNGYMWAPSKWFPVPPVIFYLKGLFASFTDTNKWLEVWVSGYCFGQNTVLIFERTYYIGIRAGST